jgi:raffinose/stachyose/melibiose transport system permease protein
LTAFIHGTEGLSLHTLSQLRANIERRGQDRSYGVEKKLVIVIFLLPAALLFFTFVIFPIFQAAFISTFKWNGLEPLDNFIGFENFITMFNHEPFRMALKHNGIIIILSVLVQLPIALLLALVVGRKLPGRPFFRAVFFLPYVISETITAVLWSFIFNPRFPTSDFINSVLDSIFPFFEPGPWLGDPSKVLTAIFVVLTWKYFGLHMVLYIAGLQDIPDEVEEAASIDGANNFQILRYVTIPMLSRTIITTVYLSVLGSLQQFDLIWLMTEGGPVNASEVLTTYMYRHGFVSFRLGYGSSVAVVLFVLCLAFSIIYQGLFMKKEFSGRVG